MNREKFNSGWLMPMEPVTSQWLFMGNHCSGEFEITKSFCVIEKKIQYEQI